MAAILVTWIANSVAIYCVAYLMRSVEVASFRDALIAGAVLTSSTPRQAVLVILTLPRRHHAQHFYFFVTAFCLWLVSQFSGS